MDNLEFERKNKMDKEERKLTTKELKRKESFERICNEMEKNGYETKNLTASILQANIAAVIIMLPFVVLIGWIYFTVNPAGSFSVEISTSLLFLPIFLCLIVLHEVIHGITWGIFAKNHFRSIDFGVIWKALTPYCTCSEPMKKWQYVIGGAMPTLILGFALAVIATGLNHFMLFVLSELMVISGGGDFFIILKMLLYRSKKKEVVYYDHPYECGVVAFEKME